MRILRDVVVAEQNGGHGSREVTLEGQAIKELVARYPDGDTLEVQTGPEGELVLTVVPPFENGSGPPHYPDLAHLLAPLKVITENIADGLRTVELSPGKNLIQRLSYLRAVIPAAANLVVEPGHEGNPFSVRLQVVS